MHGIGTVSYIDFKWNYNCLTVVNNAYELLVTLILNGITNRKQDPLDVQDC